MIFGFFAFFFDLRNHALKCVYVLTIERLKMNISNEKKTIHLIAHVDSAF